MYETGRNSFIKMGLFGCIYHCLSSISRILYSYIMNVALVGAICLSFFLTRAYASEKNAAAQERTEVVALKNNLLYDAAATPNLQLEIKLAPKWTLELGAGFNPFPLNDKTFPKWRHVSASIAPRYWFCNAFYGGFISFNAVYAHYNVAGGAYPIGWIYNQVKDNRYQGDAVMGGVSGGWHFAISPHFSIELEGGIEAGYSWYDRFECKHCGVKTETGGRWLLLPKLGINLVVPLGGDKLSFEKRCDCEKLEQAEEMMSDTVLANDTIVQSNDTTKLLSDTIIPAEPVVMEVPEPEVVVAPVIPAITVPVEQMRRLRSRLLRPEESYEPYDINVPMSADPRNVFLYFDVNVTKMDRSFIENDKLMDSIIYILGEALADSTLRITRIQIVGYASFDGRQGLNERLAASRAETIKEYIQSLYALDDSLFSLCNGGESWAELRYHLNQVDFDGRDGIVKIIDTEPDLDKREAQIRQYRNGGTYRYMKDRLRRILRNLGCITIYYERVK